MSVAEAEPVWDSGDLARWESVLTLVVLRGAPYRRARRALSQYVV